MSDAEIKDRHKELEADYRQHELHYAQKLRVIPILEKWFWLIENNEASFVEPRIWPRFPDEHIDGVIRAIDNSFENELETNRTLWNGKGIEIGSEFNRLEGKASLAFVQDLYLALYPDGKRVVWIWK